MLSFLISLFVSLVASYVCSDGQCSVISSEPCIHRNCPADLESVGCPAYTSSNVVCFDNIAYTICALQCESFGGHYGTFYICDDITDAMCGRPYGAPTPVCLC
jgi:hypothetical protein